MSNRHYKHAEGRDLAWVISSPGLLQPLNSDELVTLLDPANPNDEQNSGAVTLISDAECQRLMQQHSDWLAALDDNPRPLQVWLEQRTSHRLGYYFESLVEYWLAYRYRDGFLEKHIQVQRDKQTLGEFDFLFADPGANQCQHWEVAVKFYLYFENKQHEGSASHRWYGPLARDRLDKKVRHLVERQALLGHSDEGRQQIERYGFSGVDSRILLKGYLFYPSESDWQAGGNQHAAISPSHLKGWWTRVDALSIPSQSNKSRWLVLPRRHWLSPVIFGPDEQVDLIDRTLLSARCRAWYGQVSEPFLLVELAPGQSGGWQEVSRGFVVGEDWPKTDGNE